MPGGQQLWTDQCPRVDRTAIAAGGYHSLALKNDGTVVAWGFNVNGQTNVPGLTGVIAIAGGGLHSLALTPLTDTTPPLITRNVTGTLVNGGWYIGNVTVSWTVTDNESTITSQTGCGSRSVRKIDLPDSAGDPWGQPLVLR